MKNNGVFEVVLKEAEKGDPFHYAFSPYVNISIGFFSRNENGSILISEQLISDIEIDERIKELKKSLDSIGREAKVKLKKAIDKKNRIDDVEN